MTDYLSTFSTYSSQAYAKGLTFDENTAPTIDTIRALIASGVPVEVGIVVYNEYMNEKDWRFNASIDTQNNIAGGHAIILTGYTTDSTGKTIFTFKNSWGSTWGYSGYGTLDDAILTNSWGYDPSFDFITSLHS
jgi:C1A family cysteine protease